MNEKPQPLQLIEYQPKSMLRVPRTEISGARFPVIDFHTHLTWSDSESDGGIRFFAQPEDLLPVMDRRNIRTMVNLTGGHGAGLEKAIAAFPASTGRFVTFTEPCWERVEEPGYARLQADELERGHRAGARGLKILKVLGLFLKNGIGELLRIDDPRFDPMWETAGHLEMPVTIHVSDPDAFFLPIDRFNERWEELHAHPDWSFCGCNFPASQELYEARNRVMRRHPKTKFVCAHVSRAEDLAEVSDNLAAHPNMYVDIAARIGELGRQPRNARRFFEKHQDRILFGTDAIPNGFDTPQQVFGDALYQIYFRFLETEDEYFDYAPAPVPPQGRWCIHGLRLPGEILEKVYFRNAERLLRGVRNS